MRDEVECWRSDPDPAPYHCCTAFERVKELEGKMAEIRVVLAERLSIPRNLDELEEVLGHIQAALEKIGALSRA